jgi:transcription factor E2F3
MSDAPANREHLYVTDLDIIGLPCFCNDTIFAVNAPPGTTLQVPDPMEGLPEGEKR